MLETLFAAYIGYKTVDTILTGGKKKKGKNVRNRTTTMLLLGSTIMEKTSDITDSYIPIEQ